MKNLCIIYINGLTLWLDMSVILWDELVRIFSITRLVCKELSARLNNQTY